MPNEITPNSSIDSHEFEQHESVNRNEPSCSLTFLCSLITKSFDGNRSELHEFIANCNSAFKFANETQSEQLMAFVISKITGSARAQMRDKDPN